jgi:hypothetical protein
MKPKTLSESAEGTVAHGVDRRQAPRYDIVAIAEVSDPDEGKLVPGRVTQVSRGGCYLDTPKTLPVGTALKVILFRDQKTFVAQAKIIHVQERVGMGLAFIDPPQDQLAILDRWLAEVLP